MPPVDAKNVLAGEFVRGFTRSWVYWCQVGPLWPSSCCLIFGTKMLGVWGFTVDGWAWRFERGCLCQEMTLTRQLSVFTWWRWLNKAGSGCYSSELWLWWLNWTGYPFSQTALSAPTLASQREVSKHTCTADPSHPCFVGRTSRGRERSGSWGKDNTWIMDFTCIHSALWEQVMRTF